MSKKFGIYYSESKYVEVEADNAEQAEEKLLQHLPIDPSVLDTDIYEVEEVKPREMPEA